jgi:hypothetical protein
VTIQFQQRYIITGHALDSVTGKPVPGIQVQANDGDSDTTRADGTYEFDYKPAKAYQLTFIAPQGYQVTNASPLTVAVPPDRFGLDVYVRETQPPPAPVIYSSTHPFTNLWYNNVNPVLSWTTPADPSGIAMFCYRLDSTSDSLPDPASDSQTTSNSVMLPNVANGVLYFHVRAQDRAGNWGQPAHYMMKVDTLAPQNASNLVSTSHQINRPSAINTVEVSWTPATDTLSGILAYGVAWNGSANPLPIQDFASGTNLLSSTNTSILSPPLANGSWFFHIRALDSAVNWAAAEATFGPFVISVLLPQLTITRIGNEVILTWPTNGFGFFLESTTNLLPNATWTGVSPNPVVSGTNNVLTNSILSSAMCYRLTSNPGSAPEAGLLAYYPLDGDANDASGNGNIGTLGQGVTFVQGVQNQAAHFNGTNYIDFGPALGNFGQSDFTISAWVRTGSGGGVIAKRAGCGGGPFLDVRLMPSAPTNQVLFEASGTEASSPYVSIPINLFDAQWHQIVVERQSTNLSCFVDELVSAQTTTAQEDDLQNGAQFQLGTSPCAGLDSTPRFTGEIDEVRIYSRALSATEIQQLYTLH